MKFTDTYPAAHVETGNCCDDMLYVFQDEVQELNRRLTTIECQLRKSELSRKHLEVSNRKLLGFAQVRIDVTGFLL